VHENTPVLSVVKDPVVQLVLGMITESKTRDAIALDAAKPVPDTVTLEATRPDVGLTVIAGVTLNDWALAAVLVNVSVPTTK
jgi:hypothetical protein